MEPEHTVEDSTSEDQENSSKDGGETGTHHEHKAHVSLVYRTIEPISHSARGAKRKTRMSFVPPPTALQEIGSSYHKS